MLLTISLGILLTAGLIGGVIAGWIGTPRVTLFIVMGLLLGPSALDWIPHEHLHELEPVLNLALAIVLMQIGSRFTLVSFRRIMKAAVPLSLGEIVCTFGLVALGTYLIGESPEAALLLGGLALATAPATTIVVLQDYDSDGPVTAYTYLLVALNNFVAIVAFEVLFVAANMIGGRGNVDMGSRLQWLAIDLVGSVTLGTVAGIVVSLAETRVAERKRNLAVFAAALLLLGLCEKTGMPYLLAFLAMGVSLANTSPRAKEIVAGLSPISSLLYVLFFVSAGAELNLMALKAVGAIGATYIVMRCLGKYLGVRAVAWMRGEPQSVQNWLGATLIAQAGAAIGLVQVAAARDPELGDHLKTIVVGTVVFFEVVGPLLTRWAIVRAGEVPVAHLVHPDRPSWRESMTNLIRHFRRSLGQDPLAKRQQGELKVHDLMRQNVKSIPSSADFLQVLDFIEHSRDLVYPVVNNDCDVVGTIRYRDIRSNLFDPAVASLVRAEDLCIPPRSQLLPEQSIDDALRAFEKNPDGVILVVASVDVPTLVGLIERRDVVRFAKRHLSDSSGRNENSGH
ncbi:cation:proton antiporter domain-containing protein [Thalassoroseus pseudoceratinae]|uniref:cation:proton antiporter domain-containing protein n=1 Tax=Thalassoroseus pseudoceratinae TaxID=2713176 RepID=UPI00141F2F19|nr:cation:proton antiporter [Thalassoroseus pseudoceratinae]